MSQLTVFPLFFCFFRLKTLKVSGTEKSTATKDEHGLKSMGVLQADPPPTTATRLLSRDGGAAPRLPASAQRRPWEVPPQRSAPVNTLSWRWRSRGLRALSSYQQKHFITLTR